MTKRMSFRSKHAEAPVVSPPPQAPVLPTSTMSPQQKAVEKFVTSGKGNAFVEAVAGSGKTTTLLIAAQKMIGQVAFVAFNKKIADEIKVKTATMENVKAGTFHSFGFSAWRQVARTVRVDAGRKTMDMHDAIGTPQHYRQAVRGLVSLAKQSAVYVSWDLRARGYWRELIEHFDILTDVEKPKDAPEPPEAQIIEELIDLAIAGVEHARRVGKTTIDFDDMLWLPLVEDVKFWQYDWVLVDEAQDTNECRRLIAAKMLKPNGRMLWVGDRYQSIYGFTGADANAVDLIVSSFNCALLPLTVTYRCSKAATELARQYVPEIRAHENNAQGAVLNLSATATRRMVEYKEIKRGDAILCRNTKPLIALAFELIRGGIGCHVEGRDIGKQLITLSKKWKVDTVKGLLVNLEAYRQRETEKMVARNAEYAIEALNDRIDTLIILTDGVDTVKELHEKIDRMFEDTDADEGAKRVTLSTIHKAKGREWGRVFILGWPKYMPSRFAKQQWEKEQEANLAYVAVTRTKNELFLTEPLD